MKIWTLIRSVECTNEDSYTEVEHFNTLEKCRKAMEECYKSDIDKDNLGYGEEIDEEESYLGEDGAYVSIVSNNILGGGDWNITYKIVEKDVK